MDHLKDFGWQQIEYFTVIHGGLRGLIRYHLGRRGGDGETRRGGEWLKMKRETEKRRRRTGRRGDLETGRVVEEGREKRDTENGYERN